MRLVLLYGNTGTTGRITERIDNFNNRTDYDNRSILFKRYRGYSYEENSPLGGLVGISGLTGTTGVQKINFIILLYL